MGRIWADGCVPRLIFHAASYCVCVFGKLIARNPYSMKTTLSFVNDKVPRRKVCHHIFAFIRFVAECHVLIELGARAPGSQFNRGWKLPFGDL